MSAFTVDDVLAHIGSDADVVGLRSVTFDKVSPLGSADGASISWLSGARDRSNAALAASKAAVVIVPNATVVPSSFAERSCAILVAQPRLAFARAVRSLFPAPPTPSGVHPSAVIHPEAVIAPSAYIGPYCVIGRARIAEHSVLDGHVHVYDGVSVGARASIAAHAVLGVDGFGYARDEDTLVHFPHLGGVIIGADVRIGSYTSVVRGSLSDTVVGDGTKLDNYVTIGHNAVVGARVLIAAHVVVSGSVRIGDDVWISPNVTVLNGVAIARGAVLGAGACIASDVPEHGTVVARASRLLPRAFWRKKSPLA